MIVFYIERSFNIMNDMESLFASNAWKILSMFFNQPRKKKYVKEVARELKISTGSASVLLKELAASGYLLKQKQGMELFYSLRNDDPVVKKLRTAYFLTKLQQFNFVESILKIDSYATVIAVYGSYVSGNYDEASDLDLLILSNKREEDFYEVIKKIESKLNLEVSLTLLKPVKWIKLADQKDAFYNSVVKNNVVLYGNLVMQ